MQKIKKLVTMVLLAATATAAIMPAAPAKAAASHMKQAKLKWDLKKNKLMPIKIAYTGNVKSDATYKMTKFKLKNAKKKGYKQVTFTLKSTPAALKDKNTVTKIARNHAAGNAVGGQTWYAVVDYNTGKSLEAKNTFDVNVKTKSKKKTKKYKGTQDYSVTVPEETISITITYPQNYKGLCIGTGGLAIPFAKKSEYQFFSGKTSFMKTNLYKKNEKNSHWMRIK